MAGRVGNPRVKLLLSADTFYTEAPRDYRSWIDRMYAAVPDLNSYFDAVAIHPYSAGVSPDVYTPGQGTRWQFRRIEEMRAKFVAHGAGDKSFWITELGWATCTQHEDWVTESEQAEYLSRGFAHERTSYRSFHGGGFGLSPERLASVGPDEQGVLVRPAAQGRHAQARLRCAAAGRRRDLARSPLE
jgi:hypothetical protein